MVSSKGQLGFENAWLFVSLLIVAVGLIFGLQAFSELNDDIQSDLELSAEAKQVSQESAGNAPTLMDNVFFFLFIGLWAFILIAAYFSASNPIFTFVAIILGVIGLVVVMMGANVYEEATSDDGISAFVQEFPKTNWIMSNILIMMIFVTFSTMLVLYARNS